jgi:hypothetical protein
MRRTARQAALRGKTPAGKVKRATVVLALPQHTRRSGQTEWPRADAMTINEGDPP